MKHLFAILAFGAISVGANAQVIMNQIGASPSDVDFGTAYASQDFEAAFDTFDVAVIDDFTIGSSLNLTQVEAVTLGWSGFVNYNPISSYRVEIYSSIAQAGTSLTGNIGSQNVASGSVTVNTAYNPASALNALVTIPVNILLPSAGTYWVAVIPVNSFTNNGQIGIVNATFAGASPGGLNAMQANPGLGFAMGATFPTTAPANAAYRLTAAPVPEPATMATLAAALGALALRRRKRS